MIVGISGKIGSGKDTVGQIIQYLTSPNGFGGMDILTFIKRYEGRIVDCNWEVKKFADKLKDIVCMLIGCTRKQLENREFKEKELGEEWWYYKCKKAPGTSFFLLDYLSKPNLDGLYDAELIKTTPRLLLQLLGTNCGRDILHPNIWVNSLMADYKSITTVSPYDSFDTYQEFPNWLITDTRFPNEAETVLSRKGILIRVNRGDGNTGDHPSETSLDDYNKWSYVIDNNGSMEDLIENVREILTKEKLI